jgi:hypothetical protein
VGNKGYIGLSNITFITCWNFSTWDLTLICIDGRFCDTNRTGPFSAIEPLFPVEPLSPEIVDRSSVESKEKSQMSKVQQEIKVILVRKDRPSIQSKV